LSIDPRKRKVVGHMTREEADRKPGERLEDLMEKVKRAKSAQETVLEQAKAREAGRRRRLDDLFTDAANKARESGDDDPPTGPAW
jgi:hypothetical protein